MEKCYGISKAGKNNCAAGLSTTCAGTSTIYIKVMPVSSCPREHVPVSHHFMVAEVLQLSTPLCPGNL
ncbi:MAG: DUF2282 domain-containing protein [Parvularculales bacterium]